MTVYTDSRFVINAATKWLKRWLRNGWMTKYGYEVKNRASFEDLNDAISRIRVSNRSTKSTKSTNVNFFKKRSTKSIKVHFFIHGSTKKKKRNKISKNQTHFFQTWFFFQAE